MIEINPQTIAGVLLILVSAIGAAAKMLLPKLGGTQVVVSPPATATGATRSSDAVAPEGVTDYLKVIEGASPTATPDIRWGYASAGLTEAAVLRAEVQRLGAPKS